MFLLNDPSSHNELVYKRNEKKVWVDFQCRVIFTFVRAQNLSL